MVVDGKRRRLIIALVNFAWGGWALLGGVAFLTEHETIGRQTTLSVFGNVMYGYGVVGWALVVCGVGSLLGACRPRIGKVAAIALSVSTAGVAMTVQAGSPSAQADVDTWLLLACSFTCLMIWGLYELEPRLDE